MIVIHNIYISTERHYACQQYCYSTDPQT